MKKIILALILFSEFIFAAEKPDRLHEKNYDYLMFSEYKKIFVQVPYKTKFTIAPIENSERYYVNIFAELDTESEITSELKSKFQDYTIELSTGFKIISVMVDLGISIAKDFTFQIQPQGANILNGYAVLSKTEGTQLIKLINEGHLPSLKINVLYNEPMSKSVDTYDLNLSEICNSRRENADLGSVLSEISSNVAKKIVEIKSVEMRLRLFQRAFEECVAISPVRDTRSMSELMKTQAEMNIIIKSIKVEIFQLKTNLVQKVWPVNLEIRMK